MKTKFQMPEMSLTDVENLVALLSELSCDVNAKAGSKYFDARSFVSMANISTQEFTLEAITDDKELLKKFEEICKKYGSN